MRIFLTADTHFAHQTRSRNALSLGSRGDCFVDMDIHNGYLLESINSRVERNDRLIIAGDFAFSKPQKWRQMIRCRNIWMVMGNHDRPQATIHAFGEAPTLRRLRFPGGLLYACHYPMFQWPASHRGSYHAYGHAHSGVEDQLDRIMPGRRSLDVGVDNAYRLLGEHRPFELCEFLDLLADRPGHHPGGEH